MSLIFIALCFRVLDHLFFSTDARSPGIFPVATTRPPVHVTQLPSSALQLHALRQLHKSLDLKF